MYMIGSGIVVGKELCGVTCCMGSGIVVGKEICSVT